MSSKVVVLGSTGYIGSATVEQLCTQASGNATVFAGVRNPSSDKAKALEAKGAKLVQADMSNPTSLPSAVEGASAVLIVVPGHAERTQQAINAINACKAANVGHLVVLSVMSAIPERKSQIFGGQFIPIEEATAASGLPYTIARLPMFLDNMAGQGEGVKGAGQVYTPTKPNQVHNAVSVADVGEAFAKVLLAPQGHAGKTYKWVGPAASDEDLAAGIGKVAGKTVEHVEVPYDACKQACIGLGMPEWQADGVVELYKNINDKAEELITPYTDLSTVLGRPAKGPFEVAQYLAGVFA